LLGAGLTLEVKFMKLRGSQIDDLAAATMNRGRKDSLFELRGKGFEVQEDAKTGEILVRDKAGGIARVESLGLRTKVTGAEGATTEFEQYAYGRIKRIVDPAGREVRFERENEGFLRAIDRGPAGGRFGFELSRDWKPLRIEYPDRTVSSAEYTAGGNPALVTNRDGTSIGYEYTVEGRLAAIVDPQGRRTQITYPAPAGSRVIAYPNGDRHEYVEDIKSNAQKFIVNGETHAEYRSNGKSIEVKFQDGSVERFTFDQGRLLEAENDHAKVRFTYDSAGRLLSEEMNGEVVQYQRNAVGALVTIVTPQGDSLKYVRDRDQRLTEIVDWTGGRYEIRLPFDGSPTEINYPNGVSSTTTANAMGLPSSWTLSGSRSGTLDQATWHHDLCDRLIGAERLGMRREYRYDKASRLTDVHCSEPSLDEHFDLDSCGNPVAASLHDPANRLLRRGERTFTYDALGNQISDQSGWEQRRYEYDGAGRLAKVHQSGRSIEYAYDPLGRRIAKKVDGVTTRFQWAGIQLISESVDDGKNAIRRDYLFCPEFMTPLAFREDKSVWCIHGGRLQEPLCVTDSVGSIVWQADYLAYGKAQVRVDRVRLPFRLPGQYHDEETGLHYSVARYYDSDLGRFLSLDPVRLPGGGCNYYLYCDGDPINRVDPMGAISLTLTAVLVGVGIGIAVGALVGAGLELYKQRDQPTDWSQVGYAALVGGALGGIGAAVAIVAGAALVGTLGLLGAGAAAGALGAAAEYCTSAIGTGQWNWGDFAISLVAGAAAGALTAGIGGIFAARAARQAAKEAAERAAKELADRLAKEAEERAAKELADRLAKEAEELAARQAAEAAAAKASRGLLSDAGKVPDKGGLTKAGRSLAKHSAGKRPGSSKFPPATGSPGQINNQGQAVLDDILKDPASVYKVRPGKGGDDILQVSKPDGTGAIYKKDGGQWVFSHFGENLY
jgi:RHS repeat-associated protein